MRCQVLFAKSAFDHGMMKKGYLQLHQIEGIRTDIRIPLGLDSPASDVCPYAGLQGEMLLHTELPREPPISTLSAPAIWVIIP
jgi:hypothetical protein